MELTVSVLSIAGALVLGAMSPGPSFVMVARTALSSSRMNGLAAALGMGVGGVLFAGVALLGLHAVLSAVPSLYLGLKVLGGAYLIVLGWLMWRGAREPLHIAGQPVGGGTLLRSFCLGLLTQASNPKTAVVYASIFASLLPRDAPVSILLTLPLLVFAIEVGWYALVALALSAPMPRSAYLRSKTWIDRAAGSVMAVLGVKLIFGARHG